MKPIVDTHIRIPRSQSYRREIKQLRRKLTLDNPEYINRLKLGKSTWKVADKIEAYVLTNDELIVPRGYVKMVKELFPGITFDDQRASGEVLSQAPLFPFELREYQKDAVSKMKKKQQGVVIIPCGGGKTVVAVELIRRIKTTTIILVHTLDLLSQWKDVLKSAGVNAGQIGNGKCEVKPVTIAMVQTLFKKLNEFDSRWYEQWGCIIQDECLIGNTLIPMADGTLKEIKNMQLDDQVVSFNPITLRTSTGRVTKIHEASTTDLIRIRTSQSIIECTPNHRLWVYRDGGLKKIIANDIKPEDYLPAPRQLPHNTRRANETVENSVLRFYAAVSMCGHVSKDCNSIKIEISKDKEWYERIVKDFATLRQVKKYSSKTTYRGTLLLTICDPDIKSELISKAGVVAGKKSKVITIPDWIFKLPLRQIAVFISTCFSCEGNVGDKALFIGVCSSDFIKRLQLLLLKFGIGSNQMEIDRSSKANCNNVFRCSITGEHLARYESVIGLNLPRKQASLIKEIQSSRALGETLPVMDMVFQASKELKIGCKVLSQRYNIYLDKRSRSITRNTVAKLLDLGNGRSQIVDEIERLSRIRLLKVTNIQQLTIQPTAVYDLTVEADHTFCANGLFTSNCHRAPAHTYYQVINHFPARFRFGLTATPDREDGLTPLMYYIFGDPVYEIERKTLVKQGYLTPVSVQPIHTEFEYPYYGPADMAAMLDELVKDVDRNAHIVAEVFGAVEAGHTCLVLTGRVEHAEYLHQKIKSLGIPSNVLLGKVKKADREKVRKNVLNGKIKAIIATTVADEGLDIPNLSAVFFTFPGKAQARILQRAGRIMRPSPGKPEAIIYDFVDLNIKPLKRQYFQRRKAYHQLRAALFKPQIME